MYAGLLAFKFLLTPHSFMKTSSIVNASNITKCSCQASACEEIDKFVLHE